MARHTAKSHKIRKVEILVIQIRICTFRYRIVKKQTFLQKNAFEANAFSVFTMDYGVESVAESGFILQNHRKAYALK